MPACTTVSCSVARASNIAASASWPTCGVSWVRSFFLAVSFIGGFLHFGTPRMVSGRVKPPPTTFSSARDYAGFPAARDRSPEGRLPPRTRSLSNRALLLEKLRPECDRDGVGRLKRRARQGLRSRPGLENAPPPSPLAPCEGAGRRGCCNCGYCGLRTTGRDEASWSWLRSRMRPVQRSRVRPRRWLRSQRAASRARPGGPCL